MAHSRETDIMTLKELADYLKVAEKTIYRLANDDKIPAFKVGGSWRFKKQDIDLWIAKQGGMSGDKK